jgi:hypothetical protein
VPRATSPVSCAQVKVADTVPAAKKPQAERKPGVKATLYNLFKQKPDMRIKVDAFIKKHAPHAKAVTVLPMVNDLKNPKDANGKLDLLHIVKDDDGTLHLAE